MSEPNSTDQRRQPAELEHTHTHLRVCTQHSRTCLHTIQSEVVCEYENYQIHSNIACSRCVKFFVILNTNAIATHTHIHTLIHTHLRTHTSRTRRRRPPSCCWHSLIKDPIRPLRCCCCRCVCNIHCLVSARIPVERSESVSSSSLPPPPPQPLPPRRRSRPFHRRECVCVWDQEPARKPKTKPKSILRHLRSSKSRPSIVVKPTRTYTHNPHSPPSNPLSNGVEKD